MGLVKMVKPLDIVRVLAKHLDLQPLDAARGTLELVKGANGIQDKELERYVREGLPLIGPKEPGQSPAPVKLKKAKPNIDEMSPMRGEPEFQKHLFPPEKHRKFANNFPYDVANVRWSRVRGTTPKPGHQT